MNLLFRFTLFMAMLIMIARVAGYSAARVTRDPVAYGYLNSAALLTMLLDRAPSVEALTVGASHNAAINFETLGEQGFHYWRGGTDVFEVQHQLTVLLPHLPNLKTVYVATPYPFFLHDNRNNPTVTDIRRRQSYAALPGWRFIPGDGENFVRGKLHHLVPLDYIMRKDHWRQVLKAFAHGTIPDLIQALEPDGYHSALYHCIYTSPQALIQNSQRRARSHYRMTQRAQNSNSSLTKATLHTTVQLIELLQARGIDVVFYTPPYFETYTQLSDGEIIYYMKETMAQLQQVYGIEYYDFSTDPFLSTDYRLFSDSDHLNLCGARQFSARLRQARVEHASTLQGSR